MATYKFESVDCNLCGSKDKELISEKGLYDLPANVVLCKNCGLGYLSPRWTAGSYLEFYRNEYDNYYRPALNPQSFLKPQTDNVIINRLKLYKLNPVSINSLLDIGSGEGQNLIDFKLEYPPANLFAIEVSVRSIEHLHQNGVMVISKNFDNSWDLDYNVHFDFIIMRHVLEHFMNPVEIMNKVRRVLSPDGLAYIAVPNNLKPISKLETAWFRNVHTYYFNKYSMKNLMKISGFEVLLLVEGDQHNLGELFMVVRKTSINSPIQYSQGHYKEQLSVFKKKLKRDKSRIYKLYKKYLRLHKKVLFKLKYLVSRKKD